MANRTFSVSSNCLKSATVVLLIVLVTHIVGFSLPRWISVETTITEHAISLKTEAGYHAGLWQHCGCASFRDTGACLCFSRTNDPTWFNMVQATETIGLIGLTMCLLLSVIMLFYEQTRKRKIANVLILLVSGVLIIVGLVIFKIKSDEMVPVRGMDSFDYHVIADSKLNYAYFLCGVAGCLGILVGAPLFLKDLCTSSPDTLHEASVHYTAQPTNVDHGGYMRQSSDEQFGFPPAYEPRYVPHHAELPYKS